MVSFGRLWEVLEPGVMVRPKDVFVVVMCCEAREHSPKPGLGFVAGFSVRQITCEQSWKSFSAFDRVQGTWLITDTCGLQTSGW